MDFRNLMINACSTKRLNYQRFNVIIIVEIEDF